MTILKFIRSFILHRCIVLIQVIIEFQQQLILVLFGTAACDILNTRNRCKKIAQVFLFLEPGPTLLLQSLFQAKEVIVADILFSQHIAQQINFWTAKRMLQNIIFIEMYGTLTRKKTQPRTLLLKPWERINKTIRPFLGFHFAQRSKCTIQVFFTNSVTDRSSSIKTGYFFLQVILLYFHLLQHGGLVYFLNSFYLYFFSVHALNNTFLANAPENGMNSVSFWNHRLLARKVSIQQTVQDVNFLGVILLLRLSVFVDLADFRLSQ